VRLTWQEFPGAPALGTKICAVADIPCKGVLSVALGEYPVLVLKAGADIQVFVNACPHQFLPLDQRSSSVISTDGLRLMCSNHHAEFNISNGEGASGHGLYSCLSIVPTHIYIDTIVVGRSPK